jgi:hypothetical protein
MWLLLLRPLIVLQTILLRSSSSAPSPAAYVDFGTHFVLVFAALFVPFSANGGFRQAKRLQSIDSIDSGRTVSYFDEEPTCATRYRNLPTALGSRCDLYRY